MMQNYKYILTISIISSFFTTACKKFVEVDPPVNQQVSSEVFINDQAATSAVLGVYSRIMAGNESFLNGAYSLYAGLSADELTTAQPNTNADPFVANTILSNSGIVVSNFWQPAYAYIYQVNSCLEGISKATGMSPAAKQQLTGEMKFTRALCYFYLCNTFSDVPLETSSDYTINQSMPRTPVVNVYQQILGDLHDAQTLLPAAYPGGVPIRPNKWAATALLARVYLYQQNWTGADSASTAVINSGSYSLLTDLNKIFLSNSKEGILQFVPNQATFNSSEGRSFLQNGTTIPYYVVTGFLTAAFEPSDIRPLKWLDTIKVGTTNYIVPYKFKINTSASTAAKTEYNMVLRYSEQFLVRAEARAQQNNITGAKQDLDTIRTRAGLPKTTAADQASLLTAVLHERQVELFAEWGHRWFDLKRTGKINTILAGEKSGWQSNAALYPVPFKEIQLNPFLTQNQGYQ